jgi:hypothetical protein
LCVDVVDIHYQQHVVDMAYQQEGGDMSKPVRIKPEPKTPPELRKLARALLMLAEQEQRAKAMPKPEKAAN